MIYVYISAKTLTCCIFFKASSAATSLRLFLTEYGPELTEVLLLCDPCDEACDLEFLVCRELLVISETVDALSEKELLDKPPA